jgi:hypothetical protein
MLGWEVQVTVDQSTLQPRVRCREGGSSTTATSRAGQYCFSSVSIDSCSVSMRLGVSEFDLLLGRIGTTVFLNNGRISELYFYVSSLGSTSNFIINVQSHGDRKCK